MGFVEWLAWRAFQRLFSAPSRTIEQQWLEVFTHHLIIVETLEIARFLAGCCFQQIQAEARTFLDRQPIPREEQPVDANGEGTAGIAAVSRIEQKTSITAVISKSLV